MSYLSNDNNLIFQYNETYQQAEKVLKTLEFIPYLYIKNENEYKFINRAINILLTFLELKTITKEDIEIVQEIIKVANQETLFACYLLQFEKDFCNREFSKYLETPTTYIIPNLETFIENGDFIKLYIEYKIEKYNEQKSKENQEIKNSLSKTIKN